MKKMIIIVALAMFLVNLNLAFADDNNLYNVFYDIKSLGEITKFVSPVEPKAIDDPITTYEISDAQGYLVIGENEKIKLDNAVIRLSKDKASMQNTEADLKKDGKTIKLRGSAETFDNSNKIIFKKGTIFSLNELQVSDFETDFTMFFKTQPDIETNYVYYNGSKVKIKGIFLVKYDQTYFSSKDMDTTLEFYFLEKKPPSVDVQNSKENVEPFLKINIADYMIFAFNNSQNKVHVRQDLNSYLKNFNKNPSFKPFLLNVVDANNNPKYSLSFSYAEKGSSGYEGKGEILVVENFNDMQLYKEEKMGGSFGKKELILSPSLSMKEVTFSDGSGFKTVVLSYRKNDQGTEFIDFVDKSKPLPENVLAKVPISSDGLGSVSCNSVQMEKGRICILNQDYKGYFPQLFKQVDGKVVLDIFTSFSLEKNGQATNYFYGSEPQYYKIVSRIIEKRSVEDPGIAMSFNIEDDSTVIALCEAYDLKLGCFDILSAINYQLSETGETRKKSGSYYDPFVYSSAIINGLLTSEEPNKYYALAKVTDLLTSAELPTDVVIEKFRFSMNDTSLWNTYGLGDENKVKLRLDETTFQEELLSQDMDIEELAKYVEQGKCVNFIQVANRYLAAGTSYAHSNGQTCVHPPGDGSGLTCACFIQSVIHYTNKDLAYVPGDGGQLCGAFIHAGLAKAISKSDLQPGDIISKKGGAYGHVLMYYGSGKVIHSTSYPPAGSVPYKKGVIVSDIDAALGSASVDYCRLKQCE